MTTLQNWSVHFDGSAYTPPECQRKYLVGDVYNDPRPRFHDGKHISTGYIANVVGRDVTTTSGSVYRLGRISPKYRRWLKARGIAYDPKRPIYMIESTKEEE